MLWVSIILGLICMAIGKNSASWLIAKISGREYHTGFNWAFGPKVGTEVDYWDFGPYQAITDTASSSLAWRCCSRRSRWR